MELFDFSFSGAGLFFWCSFLPLIYIAACRVLACDSWHRKWPWDFSDCKKWVKISCSAAAVITFILLTIALSFRQEYLPVILMWYVLYILVYIAFVWLFQWVFMVIYTVGYFFYMMGLYFFKK